MTRPCLRVRAPQRHCRPQHGAQPLSDPVQSWSDPTRARQESYYELLRAGSFLSEEETDVLAWGRNARVTVPPRFKASGSHAVTYKRATAVECLVRALAATQGRGERRCQRTPLQDLAEQGSLPARGERPEHTLVQCATSNRLKHLDVTAI